MKKTPTVGEILQAKGVSRRGFLKYCATTYPCQYNTRNLLAFNNTHWDCPDYLSGNPRLIGYVYYLIHVLIGLRSLLSQSPHAACLYRNALGSQRPDDIGTTQAALRR